LSCPQARQAFARSSWLGRYAQHLAAIWRSIRQDRLVALF